MAKEQEPLPPEWLQGPHLEIEDSVKNNEGVVVEPETLLVAELLPYIPAQGGIPRSMEDIRARRDFAGYLIGEALNIRLINFSAAVNGFPYSKAELPDYIDTRTILAFSIDAVNNVKD